MKPGRELDALVATKVMGVGWCQLMPELYATSETGPKLCSCGAIGYPYEHHTPYSTDIAAAWQVVEKLYDLGWDSEVQLYKHVSGDPYYRITLCGIVAQENAVLGFADTAPHAICLAALKAVGYEHKE